MDLYNYRAKIVRVVDGDTVDVDFDLGFDTWIKNQRVRLNGVDTPEVRTRDLMEKDAGLLAKDKVEEFLPVDSWCVEQTELKDKDKYGRVLCTFWVDDTNVNQYLIDNNYAVSYHGQSKTLVEAAHQKNYSILRQRGEIDGIIE